MYIYIYMCVYIYMYIHTYIDMKNAYHKITSSLTIPRDIFL